MQVYPNALHPQSRYLAALMKDKNLRQSAHWSFDHRSISRTVSQRGIWTNITPGLRPASAPNIERAIFVHERLGMSRSNQRQHGSLMIPSQKLSNGWRSSHLSNCFGHEPQILAGQLCYVRSANRAILKLRIRQGTSKPLSGILLVWAHSAIGMSQDTIGSSREACRLPRYVILI